MSTEGSALADLFGDGMTDPYPLYDVWRTEPVRRDEAARTWLLANHQAAAMCLRDRRFVCPVHAPPRPLTPTLTEVAREVEALYRFRCHFVLHREGEDHVRLRRLLQPHFTVRAISGLEPGIRRLAESLIDAGQGAKRMDLVTELAVPLATTTIALALGVPLAGVERFTGWSSNLVYPWPESAERSEAQVVRDAFSCLGELRHYVARLTESRRDTPRGDVVSDLAHAEARGELTPTDVAANLVFLCESGRHTTASLIANAVRALLTAPATMAELRGVDRLPDEAVDELLRYDTPGVTTNRVALEDVEVGGHRIDRDDLVLPLLGAANRDPAEFPEPSRLDLSRREGSHLGFGAGRHFCIGAALARLEVSVAVTTMIRRLPGLRLGEGPADWRAHPSLRLHASLPVVWDGEGPNGPHDFNA